jgi:hypothetical protein
MFRPIDLKYHSLLMYVILGHNREDIRLILVQPLNRGAIGSPMNMYVELSTHCSLILIS